MMFSNVLLPQPLGPSNETISPERIESETSFSAASAPVPWENECDRHACDPVTVGLGA